MVHVQNRVAGEIKQPRMVVKTATCTLAAHERHVLIDSSGGADITITLPPPDECVGAIFTLYVSAYSGAITISDGSKSADFTAPTFNGVDDGQCLYCDGRAWWQFGTRT